jgi:hypothetical protein
MLFLTLNDLRTYNTFFETGINFGVSESTAHRIELWVEESLITDGSFALPGKKILTDETYGFELMLVDVTEHPIEGPQKNRNITILERKSSTVSKHKKSLMHKRMKSLLSLRLKDTFMTLRCTKKVLGKQYSQR